MILLFSTLVWYTLNVPFPPPFYAKSFGKNFHEYHLFPIIKLYSLRDIIIIINLSKYKGKNVKFFSHEELIHFIETVVIIIIIRTVSFPPSHRFCAISVGGLGGGWFFLVGGCFSKGGRGGPPPRFQELISTTGVVVARPQSWRKEREEGRKERKKKAFPRNGGTFL